MEKLYLMVDDSEKTVFAENPPRRGGAASLSSRVLDFLLPHRCLACDDGLGEGPGLCPACWSKVRFVEAPFCESCGRPFEIDPEDGLLCAACIAEPPLFDRARAVMIYDDASRPLVTGFKYADRTDFAGAFGGWLSRAGHDVLDQADYLVPVPLHPWRLWMRRYNQSGILAAAISRETLIPVLYDGLLRVRHTRQQVGLTASRRRRNVAGAFRVNPKRAEILKGAHIVLIDDVVTSGATATACLRVMRRQKPATLGVLSLARTMR